MNDTTSADSDSEYAAMRKTKAQEYAAAHAVARELLNTNVSFRRLTAEERTRIAQIMVGAAAYIAGGEHGDAGADDLIDDVDFPGFVAGLLQGTFQAIINASIKQMDAYVDLLEKVSGTVDLFMADRVGKEMAGDYLVEHYPTVFGWKGCAANRELALVDDFQKQGFLRILVDLGVDSDDDGPDASIIEERLVPAAMRQLQKERQQQLATMVLMGINRIIVSENVT